MKLWLDTETRSSIALKRYGIYHYVEDVTVILVQWALEGQRVRVWDRMQQPVPPAELIDAINRSTEVWAHVAEFDRTMMPTIPGIPVIPMHKWRCTAALARMHGLPGGMDKLCQIFKLPLDQAKDSAGKALIQLFCVPKPDGTYNDFRSHPAEWQQFIGYGAQDIVTMRVLHRKIPHWNATPRMWRLWHLDQKMNDRGIGCDVELAKSILDAAVKAQKRMADRTSEITEGDVEATTQRNRLLAYLADHGVDLPDLTADTVERRLEDESLPEYIKELLRIRQQASKSSSAKCKRLLNMQVDGRLRGLLLFCGAARTGRWSGRVFQPQNLPRPKHKQDMIDAAIKLFKSGDIELLDPDQVLGLASSCLRGLLVAEHGRELVVSDYANIEGRKMAWIAGEQWKLDAFASYDAKTGPDLYKVAYARSFNIDPFTIGDEDPRRQIGKVMELALQYYGGVGAFCSMAETYGLRLEAMADAAWPALPREVREQAEGDYLRAIKRRRTYGLERKVWIVCQSLVLMWRAAHPAIVSFWSKLEVAVKCAVKNEGVQYPVGRVVVDRQKAWLRIRLPSGRYLCYPSTRLDDRDSPSFVGINPYSRQWGRISTYSGKLTENIVQASSADILMDGLLAADEAGFEPVLSVHDEVICEPLKGVTDDKELSKLLVEASGLWAEGMPMAAKGFTRDRYKK